MELNWLPSPYDAPFYLAQQDGYYRDAGLKVRIIPGKGSALTGQTVANGTDTFGWLDATTATRLISKGAPIKLVADFMQQTDMAFIHQPALHIRSLKDLEGHPIVTGAADSLRIVLDAMLAKAGMSEKQLKMDLVQPSAEHSTFLQTPNAIYLGSVDNDLPVLQQVRPSLVATPYAKFGVPLYVYGVIARNSYLKQHPATVRAFLKATIEGWNATVKSPSTAAKAVAKVVPQLKEAVAVSGIRQTVQLLHTSATRGHPLGWMAPSDWRSMLQFLHRYLGIQTVHPAGRYYSDAFLPQS